MDRVDCLNYTGRGTIMLAYLVEKKTGYQHKYDMCFCWIPAYFFKQSLSSAEFEKCKDQI